MPIFTLIKPNLYKDSVTLMQIAQAIEKRSGVRRAALLMGTPANRDILAQSSFYNPLLDAAHTDDLMIVVETDGETSQPVLAREIDRMLEGEGARPAAKSGMALPRSLAAARARQASANLAVISVPGAYAAAEALKALRAGLNVFLFSDNVPLAEERRLKAIAERKGLIVMGPDCGTAVINDIPLGFANKVRSGNIGIVGASGTGMQEIMCQIHRLGGGISQAIGTGGRDLSEEVGGITTRAALRLLAEDAATAVIVVVAKSPSPTVGRRILSDVQAAGKEAIVLFLGAEHPPAARHLHGVGDLDEAARLAVTLAGGGSREPAQIDYAAAARREQARHRPEQRYLRGLYSGGTYALEAQILWRRAGYAIHSNAPIDGRLLLADKEVSREHTALDLGDDAFTVGRPHPMIDPSVRIERLLREAADPTVAVVVLDIVLGTGAHADPAQPLVPAIEEAKRLAAAEGRHLTVIAWICGTDADPQGLARQEAAFGEVALVVPGSTAAARLAVQCLGGG